jgi:chromosome segregation ATPase
MTGDLHGAIENFCATAERYRSMIDLAEQLKDIPALESRAATAQQTLDKLATVEADLSKAEARLNDFQGLADQLQAASQTADQSIAAKEAAITKAETKLASVNGEIDAARTQLADLKREVDTARAKLDAVLSPSKP